jgi:CHAT domain-containing protein/Tfp pilus assembly protein PilF
MVGHEKAFGPEHPDTLSSVHNLAALYQVQGRNSEAEQLWRRALAGRQKVLGPEHHDTLLSVGALGYLYLGQGRYNEAEPLLRRALAGRQKALGLEHPTTLVSLLNLGGLYERMGRYDEAESLWKRALAGYEKVLGPEHPDTLRSVLNLGGLYERQRRYSEAETLLKRALAGWEKALGPQHPDTILAINNLAALSFVQRDWPRAAQLWRQSTAIITNRVQRGASGAGLTGQKANEAQRWHWNFRALVKATYRLASEGRMPDIASAMETFQTARWALSSQTAQSMVQMAARGTKGDAALAVLVRERQDLVEEWQKREQGQVAALGRDPAKRDAKAEAANRERMAAIDGRIAEIDKRLAKEFPDYAALTSSTPLAAGDVQAQLGADEALVLFLDTQEWKPTPEETFIWVVTKTQMRWVRADLGKATLSREVEALRCGLDYTVWRASRCKELTGADYALPLPFDHARAHGLYKALFSQIDDLIKDKKHLLLVPSGALTQLPFQALITAPPAAGDHRTAAWLARSHALSVLPSVSSLQALRTTARQSIATKSMIVFGNPLLDGPDERFAEAAKLARGKQSCPKTASERIASLIGLRTGAILIATGGSLANVSLIRKQMPLPETADELCAVARDIGADPSEMRLGARATEREVKAMSERGELANYHIVHFATHGLMAGQLNAFVEPGLILTPPDKASAEDDGYLSASEVAALKLDADWVILSACNTAAGNAPTAEALSGLARAFIYAQARALLVSHWEVYSEATVKLITAAMREIAADQTVGRAEGLRRAMMALIDNGEAHEAHPAYWAPFIIVGEGER